MSKKMTVKQIKEKVQHLKGERSLWENHWQECTDYMMPRKSTVITVKPQGGKRSVTVLDSTGIQSCELLAGALHGLLTNPNAQWFELTTGDVDLDRQDDVRFFLQKASQRAHNVLNNSNFQTEIHELYSDLCCVGTGAMYVEEDDKTGIRFSTRFVSEFFIVENNRGIVDEIYFCWKWDATHLVKEFSLNMLPEKVQKFYKEGKYDKFEVIQAIYPRANVDQGSKSAFGFVSQYVLPEENFEISEGGYREFPYVVPRWTKATGETYGRSPGMNALPEVKTINKMTETTIIGAQKVVDPPMQLPDDGFILPIQTHPGGMNFYRAGTTDTIKPLFNDSRIDFGYQALDDRRKRIREAFYVDQLQLQQNGPQMTATEVLQRTEEKVRLLGPMLGRQQSELLRPLIDRVFAIMLRKGTISQKDIPAVLRGRSLDVRYSSLIAKSQRLSEGQNLMRAMEALTPIANADPSVVDNIDADKAFRVIADVYGMPQEIIRKAKDVEARRNARAQAQQEMVDREKQQQEADAAPKLAQTMQTMTQTG